MIGLTAIACLALNIYHEARSEPLQGRIAVAQVTMTRAAKTNKTVCGAVFAPKQFSWTIRAYQRGRVARAYIPNADDKSWQSAIQIARLTIAHRLPDSTRGATFYHEAHIRPYWTKRMARVTRIGQHIFYREKHT